MRKNMKGFTLVELLAVIVIMGILITLGLPMIVGMIDSNRKKIYITDAQKLVSKAENRMKANNSDIEKPDPNHCIIISLTYLDDEIFDHPPYEGQYLRDSSFVVVKNADNGTLEYSVMLVEHTKDGSYLGVELVRDTALMQRNAIKHVKAFKFSDLKNTANISETNINEWLKNSSNIEGYVGSVDSVYDFPRESEDEVDENYSSPKIEKLSVSSASNKDYASLDALLSVSVIDEDTPRNNLLFYISTVSFDAALTKNPYHYSDPESTVFTTTFDLSVANEDIGSRAYSYDYTNDADGKVVFYVVVEDEKGNQDTKFFDYIIKKNDAPEILLDDSQSQITRKLSDSINNVTADFKLTVHDDIDLADSLMVCYTEQIDATSCSNYRPYNELFNDDNIMEYTFHECDSSNTCPLDGRDVHLKVFVRDSCGAEAEPAILTYTLYENQKPSFTLLDESNPGLGYISIVSNSDTYPTEGSLDVLVRFNPTDDLTDSNHIKVTLNEMEGNSIVKTMNVGYMTNDEIAFSFMRKYANSTKDYDGRERTLKVILEDEQGLKEEAVQTYRVYANQAPTISDLEVVSREAPCSNTDFCTVEDNSQNAKVTLSSIDDMDSGNKIKVCISDNASYCASNQPDDHFSISYNDEFSTNFTFKNGQTNPYDGSTEKLYASVMDSSGVKGPIVETEYTLYKNQSPIIIESAEINDKENTTTVTNTIVVTEDPLVTEEVEETLDLTKPIGKFTYRISVLDDLTSDNDLLIKVCYRLKDEDGNYGEAHCNSGWKNYYVDSDGDDHRFEDEIDLGLTSYTGQIYGIYAIVKDSYYSDGSDNGITETPILDYEVYTDEAPEIGSVYGTYTDPYSSHTMKLNFAIRDPYDTYKVCVVEEGDDYDPNNPPPCSNYVGLSASEDFNGNHYENYVFDYTGEWTLKTKSEDGEAGEAPDDGEGNEPEYNGTDAGQRFVLLVKDSYGHITSMDFKYSYYYTCTEFNGDVTKEEYIVNTDSEAISSTRCSGKCYYWNSISDELKNKMRLTSNGPSDTNDIFGDYSRILTYQDKNIPDVFCVRNDLPATTTTVRLRCDYVDCFYNPVLIEGPVGNDGNPTFVVSDEKDPYQNLAIGLVVRTSEEPITNSVAFEYEEPNPDGDDPTGTIIHDTIDYVCNDYYQVYQTEYVASTNRILLHPIEGPNSKICLEAVEDGHYSFNANSSEFYLRVLDDVSFAWGGL